MLLLYARSFLEEHILIKEAWKEITNISIETKT